MSTALVPLAEGFEEIEAIVPVDVLRRAGVKVTTASLKEGPVTASRQTKHLADVLLTDVTSQSFDLIYLLGGRPGADHLAESQPLRKMIQDQSRQSRFLAAICAAPIALAKAGLLGGKRFTCHPGAVSDLGGLEPAQAAIVVDGRLITGRSAGVAMEMALTLTSQLVDEETLKTTEAGLICRPETLAGVEK